MSWPEAIAIFAVFYIAIGIFCSVCNDEIADLFIWPLILFIAIKKRLRDLNDS